MKNRRAFQPSCSELENRKLMSVGSFPSAPAGTPIGSIGPVNPGSVPVSVTSLSDSATYVGNGLGQQVSLTVTSVGHGDAGTVGTVVVQYQITNTTNGIASPTQSFAVTVRGQGATTFNATIPLAGYSPGQYSVSIKAYGAASTGWASQSVTTSLNVYDYVKPSPAIPVQA